MKPSKKLTNFDLTIIVVSFVIGMGIFRTPINVAQASGTPILFFAAWLIGGAIAICGALTYAEIGSRMPGTGGYYQVIAYAYHPSIAFAVNCVILVSNAASLGAVALIGGEYVTSMIMPQSQNQLWLLNSTNSERIQTIQIFIAISSIVFFYGINLLGLKKSARAQNLMTIVKLLMILLLISPLFFSSKNIHTSILSSPSSPVFKEYLKAFGISLVAVCFTYGGYQQTINFGEEVIKPKKTIPKSIFSGIFIILILYILINFAYVKVIGFEQLKSSKNIAAVMATKIFGINAERMVTVLLFLSVLAYVNVLLLSNPRVMSAMSNDNILPKAFGKRNIKNDVLTTSLSVFSAISILIIFWAKKFDTILSFTIFLDCFGMALSAGSIFKIRRNTSYLNKSGIYMIKFYPWLPIIFIAAYSFVAISLLITEIKISLIGLAVLAGFIIIYFWVSFLQKRKESPK